jgi:hypothetical protein
MSIGAFYACPCEQVTCEIKVIVANILATATPGSGMWANSYCPGVYTVDGSGHAHTTCPPVENIIGWLESQTLSDDTAFPWDTLTVGSFQLPGDGSIPGSPTSTVQTGAGGAAPSEGSYYLAGGALVASLGAVAGNICAQAQIVAMKMSGSLYVTPLNIPDVTESCLLTPGSGDQCNGGVTYYIPLPAYGLCSVALDDEGFQYAYSLYQTGNTTSCLPSFSGDHTACGTPFTDSDPP